MTPRASSTSTRLALRARAADQEPLAKVFEIGGGHHSVAVAIAVVVALIVHGTAAARTALVSLELLEWTRTVQATIADHLAQEYDLDVQKQPEPPPPPPPPEEKKDEAPKPEPPPTPDTPPPPPPAAAQAGKVLTADPDPNEPVDLTGGFVSGNGTNFAGGVTQAAGTSTAPVYNPNARATGTPGGTGAPQAAPAPVGPDRSRAARFGGNAEWDCPFPPEADADQVDDAYVVIQVVVDASGRAQKVDVLKDPGHGFGRQARTCAMQKAYDPTLDHDGRAIVGTAKLRVHFER